LTEAVGFVPRNILVRGVNWLGDAVMSTPALARLREKFPEARITLLTPEKLAQLWERHAALNHVITFASSETAFAVGKRLRAVEFDLALIFPNSFRSAAQIFFAGIPNRVGYEGQLRSPLLTEVVSMRSDVFSIRKRTRGEIDRLVSGRSQAKALHPSPDSHHIFQYLHLASAVGANSEPLAPAIHVDEEEVESACAKFAIRRNTTALIGINPGAEYGPAKRWPIENFVETIHTLSKAVASQFIIFGGKSETAIAEKIVAELSTLSPEIRASIVNLAGRTSVRELCALTKACRVFITNDTGPMHVAAAVGARVVAIFGSTSAALTGPWPTSHHRLLEATVPCAPCFLRECPIDFRCMHQIKPAQVIEATLRLI